MTVVVFKRSEKKEALMITCTFQRKTLEFKNSEKNDNGVQKRERERERERERKRERD